MLKGINGEDQHDVGRFPDKTSYGSGMFYAQSERDVPKLFDDLIRVLKEKPYVESVRIALRNERLHIAIEQTGIRLPYIKKWFMDLKIVNRDLICSIIMIRRLS